MEVVQAHKRSSGRRRSKSLGIGTEKTQLLQPTDENILLFTEWLQADHVKRWYTHRDAWLWEGQKRRKEFDWIHHYIIWKDDIPVGFCQYYPYWKSEEDWEGSISKDGTYSIDYLIGRPEYLRKGIARRAARELLRMIYVSPLWQKNWATIWNRSIRFISGKTLAWFKRRLCQIGQSGIY